MRGSSQSGAHAQRNHVPHRRSPSSKSCPPSPTSVCPRTNQVPHRCSPSSKSCPPPVLNSFSITWPPFRHFCLLKNANNVFFFFKKQNVPKWNGSPWLENQCKPLHLHPLFKIKLAVASVLLKKVFGQFWIFTCFNLCLLLYNIFFCTLEE